MDIQNTDTYSFFWSLLAQQYKVDRRRERVTNKAKHFHEINQGDRKFLMKLKDLPKLKDRLF